MPELIEEAPVEELSIEELPMGLEVESESGGYLEDLLEKGNIVEELENNSDACQKIIDLYQEAEQSMEKWLKKYKRAINLAKMQAMSGDVEITEKTFPFEGASLAMLPFVTEAMLDFNSRSAPELVWSENIISAKIYGENSEEKEERAKRVSRYQNYQLSEKMPAWRDDQDKGLMILPGVGTFYKKTTWCPDGQEVKSELYLANEIKFNMRHRNFYDAPDKFIDIEFTRNEVIGLIRGEQGWSIKEDELEEDEEEFKFIEAYTWIDLDDDDLKEPYIAVIWEEKQRIVALYPYYDEDTINRNKDDEIISIDTADCFTQYRFLPDPEGGPMGLGWGILLGPMFDAVNTSIRQLIDAGTLSNTAANSGLIAENMTSGRGNSVQKGPIEVKLGQLTPITVRGNGTLAQNVVQFPFAGPNTVLFQLMEYLITSARSMTNASVDIEANPGDSASLHLARLQQGLKVPNSITMRVYSAAKKEFQKIGLLNYKHFDDEEYNRVLDEDTEHSMEQDFNPKDCDIVLVADPAQGSDIERIQRAQAILQEAKEQPSQVINLRLAYVDWLKAMKTPNIEELAPEPDPNAVDPQQQLMMAQMMMETELKKKDQELREQGQRLQEAKMASEQKKQAIDVKMQQQKMAMQAAKEMGDMGLDADETEAKITKMYTESLKNLVDAGLTGANPIDVLSQIESRFIDGKPGQQGNSQGADFIFDPETGKVSDARA